MCDPKCVVCGRHRIQANTGTKVPVCEVCTQTRTQTPIKPVVRK